MTTATGPLQVGELLATRYLLLEAVATGGPAVLWRATDEVLARSVAVKVVPVPNRAAREAATPFLDAAVRSGRINHPGLARVYDAAVATGRGRGNDVAYVIREWVEGEPLDEHLRAVGALAGPDAADVLRQAADALTAAHAAGVAHGRVHPGNVLVTPNGRIRLTDAALATALHDGASPDPPTREDLRADTRDLAAVLYALVSARWPESLTGLPAGSLSPAPVTEGRPLSLRQLRAGVPRALDNVVQRALVPHQVPTLGPLTTPAALADATDASVADERAEREAQATPSAPSRLRRSLPWVLALAFVSAVGTAGWLLGLAVGKLEPRGTGVDAIVSTTSAPTPGVPTLTALDLSKVVVRDFDPSGDRQENADKVRNAVDGFPGTTWPTSRYRSATFGGLKPGVGLLLDLGSVRAVQGVQVGFSAPGAQVELRVSATAPASADAAQLVAAARDGKQVASLRPTAGTRARYVLIWITSLPKDGDGYRVGISELRIT